MKKIEHKYLHLFSAETEFDAVYYDDIKYKKPWVSYTKDVTRVDYNKREQPATYSRTLTYVDRGNNTTVTETQSGPVGTPLSFTVKALPSWDNEHACIGWSTAEYPTYAQTQQSGFMKQSGDILTTSENVTLYADYNTTFQGLINENLVLMNVVPEEAALWTYNTMFIKANGYAKELVVDFMDVFMNDDNHRVDINGGPNAVGDNGYTNIFSFPKSLKNTEHWLTDDDWYDLFTDTTHPFKHGPMIEQFYSLDWSDKQSVTIEYRTPTTSKNYVAKSMFGPLSPKVVNINMCGNQFDYMFQTFGNNADWCGCGAEEINVWMNDNHDPMILKNSNNTVKNGIHNVFQACFNLKRFTGLGSISSAHTIMHNCTFEGCYSLETIPQGSLPDEIVIKTSVQMFRNCSGLTSIYPEINVSGIGNPWISSADTVNLDAMFYNCQSLEDVKIKGLNADNNVAHGSDYTNPSGITLELNATKITPASITYLVNNLTQPSVYPVPANYEYKGIDFPENYFADGKITQAQINQLHDYGWITYINGVQQPHTN